MTEQHYCEVLKTTFVWTVGYPNFFLGCDSPNFSVDSYGNATFYVKLLSNKERTFVSIYLAKHETYCGMDPIAFNLKLSASRNGERGFVQEAINFKNRHMILLQRLVGLFPTKVQTHSPHSALTIRLDIEPTEEDTGDNNFRSCNPEDLERLSTDISRALNAKRFCDLTFRSIEGVKSVNLHKSILAARYRNLMSTLDFDKSTKLDCNLGIDFDAIKMLTQYLYSGNINIGRATYGLHDILKRAELDHLEHVLYPPPRTIKASTFVPSKSGSFIWIISKFSSLQEDQVLVNTFRFDLRSEWTEIRILLYIKENEDEEEDLEFKILRTVQDRKMYMLCKISIVGYDGIRYIDVYEHVFRHEREFVIKDFATKEDIMAKNDILLQNDTLKISFEFIISDLREVSEYDEVDFSDIKRGEFSPVAMNLWALQRDFKKLYLDPKHSDFTLQVEDELIPAHKVILSARSPVFSKLLEENAAENEAGRVVINDFSAVIVRHLLRYIYCGEIPDDISYADIVKLYEAAHRYQVEQLREKCSHLIAEAVSNVLTTEAVSHVLKIADEYSDNRLKESVKNFVCCHADEVFKSKKWKILMTERIDLTAGIMNAALESAE